MKQSVRQILTKIRIDEYASTPKYRQIINSVLAGIKTGVIRLGEPMPSIVELSLLFDISRDTTEKAYNHLKRIGVLGAVRGKGYYIKSTGVQQHKRIFLLFNKLSAHKKIIYDAFVDAIGDDAGIDLYIYNNSFGLFQDLIQRHLSDAYTHYVIIPHFTEGGEQAHEVINLIPKDKLIILDKQIGGIEGEFGAVYENFGRDIEQALERALPRLRHYKHLKLIFPADTYHPADIRTGFARFGRETGFRTSVVADVQNDTLRPGDVFIVLMEDDLVVLIKRLKAQGLRPGHDVGIISYNETPLKEILLDGITVISTDFRQMGQTAARLILENSVEHVENPFQLILRQSL